MKKVLLCIIFICIEQASVNAFINHKYYKKSNSLKKISFKKKSISFSIPKQPNDNPGYVPISIKVGISKGNFGNTFFRTQNTMIQTNAIFSIEIPSGSPTDILVIQVEHATIPTEGFKSMHDALFSLVNIPYSKLKAEKNSIDLTLPSKNKLREMIILP